MSTLERIEPRGGTAGVLPGIIISVSCRDFALLPACWSCCSLLIKTVWKQDHENIDAWIYPRSACLPLSHEKNSDRTEILGTQPENKCPMGNTCFFFLFPVGLFFWPFFLEMTIFCSKRSQHSGEPSLTSRISSIAVTGAWFTPEQRFHSKRLKCERCLWAHLFCLVDSARS